MYQFETFDFVVEHNARVLQMKKDDYMGEE